MFISKFINIKILKNCFVIIFIVAVFGIVYLQQTYAITTIGNNVSVGGGLTVTGNTTSTSISGLSTALSISQGGTGTTTANGSFNALAPSQTGNSGKFLTTDGADTSWATISGANPSGSDTYIQFNNGSAFGGVSNLTFSSSTKILSITNGDINVNTDTWNGLTVTVPGLGHGITDKMPTDRAVQVSTYDGSGGAYISGIRTVLNYPALILEGGWGSSTGSATTSAIMFNTFKKSGTGSIPLANGEMAYDFRNGNGSRFNIMGNGDTYIAGNLQVGTTASNGRIGIGIEPTTDTRQQIYLRDNSTPLASHTGITSKAEGDDITTLNYDGGSIQQHGKSYSYTPGYASVFQIYSLTGTHGTIIGNNNYVGAATDTIPSSASVANGFIRFELGPIYPYSEKVRITITSTVGVFDASDVNKYFEWSDYENRGTENVADRILTVSSSTAIIVETSRTIASQAGRVVNPNFRVSPTGNILSAITNSSAVTDLLINPATKTSGNLIDAQIGDSSKFSVTAAGGVIGSSFNGSIGQFTSYMASPVIYAPSLGDSLRIEGYLNSSASAISVKVASVLPLTHAGAKIVAFYNDDITTEVASINKDGGFKSAGDLYTTTSTAGVILTSPDGACWRTTVNNSGVLATATTTCQ
jgi:hypothetical protein